mmetsp:Transcript_13306/g.18177  ORF Transcript_13306/g.18177 Transcript_13306/m.18177 type:complete len:330 (+) Transcript_13306:199-1188(+)|eukprot:CAMPEP_0196579668 /NCGR_PEP_ID=MMETSP1081-20130531/24398_1 /TAXON_ID=36882 /ORGANISM="Pyramimonas amylifera, Strain CCMP720" /LENGTH=329 /DNA_ID=CAMNT_0041899319 /DNA_START=198 /DNA_END=1187 /DNA_ORIENTATION=+
MVNSFTAGVSAGLVFAGIYCLRTGSARNSVQKTTKINATSIEMKRRSQSEIIISNSESYNQKKKLLISGGLENLQVIADFDRTLTACVVNGRRGAGCHQVVESLHSLSPTYKAATAELFNKYFPIEICHELTIQEKIPLMKEWYETAHALLLKEGVMKADIQDAVRGANCDLRGGVREMILMLQSWQVPLLIFSAGIANVIQELMLQKLGLLTNSTHVISNWLNFDQSGKVSSFSEPLIHMFNKDESQTKGTDFHKAVASRGNVILLGDGLGDVTMADGISHTVVLKIGFLNEKVDELLPKFKEVYDVVITHDGSADLVVELLELIAKP